MFSEAKRDEANRERTLRSRLYSAGYQLRKSRAKHITAHNHGGYMIVHTGTNSLIAGQDFELTLDDVDAWLADYIARGLEEGIKGSVWEKAAEEPS